MVKLMPVPPHYLLLQENAERFTFLVPAYPCFPGIRLLNGYALTLNYFMLKMSKTCENVTKNIYSGNIITTQYWNTGSEVVCGMLSYT